MGLTAEKWKEESQVVVYDSAKWSSLGGGDYILRENA